MVASGGLVVAITLRKFLTKQAKSPEPRRARQLKSSYAGNVDAADLAPLVGDNQSTVLGSHDAWSFAKDTNIVLKRASLCWMDGPRYRSLTFTSWP